MKPSSITLALAATLALAGCDRTAQPTQEPVAQQQQAPQPKRYDAKAFFDTLSYSGSSLSHDGTRVLINSDQTGIYNVYAMPVGGGEPEALTHSSTDSTFAVSWFPHDDRFLFTADQGGNELFHLYVMEKGQPRDLTPGDKTRARFMGFNTDGSAFYVTTNERDPRAMDVYRYDATSYQRSLVFQNDQALSLGGISRDGRYLALTKVNSNADSDLYLWDATSPDQPPRLIADREGAMANFDAMAFSPDSQTLYFGTDAEGEFNQAWRHDLATDEQEPAVVADWDVMFVDFSESGRYRVVGVNADGSTRVTITDTSTGKALKLPELPQGDLRGVNFSRDDKRMVFYINSDTSPSNLYSYELGAKQAKRLTNALNPAINEAELVNGEVVRYQSFDGLEIPAILYKPKGASAANPAPALVWVHGGPGGQSRKGYRAAIQHLVNHGYAILAANNRGSSGYGKTFYHLDDRNHGENDLRDIVEGKGYLQSLDWADDNRIGVMGGSYGGYMTVAALTYHPDAFKVGIDIFGVTNWERTLTSIPPWWESFKAYLYAEMGDPATDLDRLKRISPLFHADRITKPLLVVQGANDPRVLQVESDELVKAVRANGVPVEYVLFDDEGHGFTKKANRITASDAYLSFLEKHLRNGQAMAAK
ncbi:S9 family peptidase [Gallaecimonas sp. GXIMD4217]|uniref:S9 family peptidase n=1 Tax=Gallaecimonas sp. GXIMD4217 TaxID=3131927 RepID=UPI00311B2C0D